MRRRRNEGDDACGALDHHAGFQNAACDPLAILGRAERPLPDIPTATFAGQTVLVTGAGGSIGLELCRQLIGLRLRRLVLLDLSEAALFSARQALGHSPGTFGVDIVTVLGSVCDGPDVMRLLKRYEIGVVLHAAAYKHVPMVEENPRPGLTVNTLGTLTLARSAEAAGVARFVLVSTDKAVRPRSVLGVSKLLAEHAVLDIASRATRTVFSVVRFGNVFGSSGSVVPVFLDQIARGGPLTLTDPDATRFFMTASEAVGLVLAAAAHALGGETFVLEMGAPVRMDDLARKLIAASGRAGVVVRVAGLRKGEKLSEELALNAPLRPTAVPGLMIADDPIPNQVAVAGALRNLRAALAADDEALARFIDLWRSGECDAFAPQRRAEGRA